MRSPAVEDSRSVAGDLAAQLHFLHARRRSRSRSRSTQRRVVTSPGRQNTGPRQQRRLVAALGGPAAPPRPPGVSAARQPRGAARSPHKGHRGMQPTPRASDHDSFAVPYFVDGVPHYSVQGGQTLLPAKPLVSSGTEAHRANPVTRPHRASCDPWNDPSSCTDPLADIETLTFSDDPESTPHHPWPAHPPFHPPPPTTPAAPPLCARCGSSPAQSELRFRLQGPGPPDGAFAGPDSGGYLTADIRLHCKVPPGAAAPPPDPPPRWSSNNEFHNDPLAASLVRGTGRLSPTRSPLGSSDRGFGRHPPFGVEGPRLALDRSPHAIPVRGPHHPADTRHSGPLAAEEEEEDTMGHGQAGAPDPVWMASSDPDADGPSWMGNNSADAASHPAAPMRRQRAQPLPADPLGRGPALAAPAPPAAGLDVPARQQPGLRDRAVNTPVSWEDEDEEEEEEEEGEEERGPPPGRPHRTAQPVPDSDSEDGSGRQRRVLPGGHRGLREAPCIVPVQATWRGHGGDGRPTHAPRTFPSSLPAGRATASGNTQSDSYFDDCTIQ